MIARDPDTGKITHFPYKVYGRGCQVLVLKDHGAGTFDIRVTTGPSALLGRDFRVTGCFPEFLASMAEDPDPAPRAR